MCTVQLRDTRSIEGFKVWPSRSINFCTEEGETENKVQYFQNYEGQKATKSPLFHSLYCLSTLSWMKHCFFFFLQSFGVYNQLNHQNILIFMELASAFCERSSKLMWEQGYLNCYLFSVIVSSSLILLQTGYACQKKSKPAMSHSHLICSLILRGCLGCRDFQAWMDKKWVLV